MSVPLLQVQNVVRQYAIGGLFGRGHRAVNDVSFELGAGRPEILAIIGESGSGKTTLARMILGTVAPSAGSIRFNGVDTATQRGRRARLAFMRQVQPIFQNPFEAFNPLKRLDRYLFMTARHFAAAADAAADYPNRPIRFIAPFVAGGPSDMLSRLLGQRMSERWGQSVIVDNRGSAGGLVGFELGARPYPTDSTRQDTQADRRQALQGAHGDHQAAGCPGALLQPGPRCRGLDTRGPRRVDQARNRDVRKAGETDRLAAAVSGSPHDGGIERAKR